MNMNIHAHNDRQKAGGEELLERKGCSLPKAMCARSMKANYAQNN